MRRPCLWYDLASRQGPGQEKCGSVRRGWRTEAMTDIFLLGNFDISFADTSSVYVFKIQQRDVYSHSAQVYQIKY